MHKSCHYYSNEYFIYKKSELIRLFSLLTLRCSTTSCWPLAQVKPLYTKYSTLVHFQILTPQGLLAASQVIRNSSKNSTDIRLCKIYRVSAYISPRGFSKVFLSYQFAFATLVNDRGLQPLPTFISRTFALNNHIINNISKYQVITILFKATTLETS